VNPVGGRRHLRGRTLHDTDVCADKFEGAILVRVSSLRPPKPQPGRVRHTVRSEEQFGSRVCTIERIRGS
jgi:hypothetical protein